MGRRVALSRDESISKATEIVRSGATYRHAARLFNLPHTTIYRHMNTTKSTAGRKRSLTDDEERIMIDLLKTFANRGVPLTQKHHEEAVAVLVGRMPALRKQQLQFKNGRPGKTFLRQFRHRHRKELAFRKPTRQEAKRFLAVNAKVLTTHFATLKKLVDDNGLDAARIFNLNEVGTTPGKDTTCMTSAKRLLPRYSGQDICMQEFKNVPRVTMLPVISADGQTGPPLFVFKGLRLPYRNVLCNGRVRTETPACNLPINSCLALRQENGGVDTVNFLHWAYSFVSFVGPLVANNRKVLLIYDGYRAHLSLDILELFYHNNIIVYALPAHTSGKLQPLDTVLFSVFKNSLNKACGRVSLVDQDKPLDIFDFCSLLREAYIDSFTVRNIRASFERAGTWPVNAKRLLNIPRPADDSPNCEIVSVEELEKALKDKEKDYRTRVLGSDAVIESSGYVSTKKGCVMTAENVLNLVRKKKMNDRKKHERERFKHHQRNRKENIQRLAASTFSTTVRRDRLNRCAQLANMPIEAFLPQVRSFSERRAAARVKSGCSHK